MGPPWMRDLLATRSNVSTKDIGYGKVISKIQACDGDAAGATGYSYRRRQTDLSRHPVHESGCGLRPHERSQPQTRLQSHRCGNLSGKNVGKRQSAPTSMTIRQTNTGALGFAAIQSVENCNLALGSRGPGSTNQTPARILYSQMQPAALRPGAAGHFRSPPIIRHSKCPLACIKWPEAEARSAHGLVGKDKTHHVYDREQHPQS
jgi:hypothetical protein